ncbi:putative transporter, Major facilitator superfamily MFS_1 [Paraburkholderia piptadeniae]|uniref:Transporter, Major facilitator superfamily MFS_1 n=1 Tax=Paraburkholderia piptadeniae TaxID=1701573 RepID=A0A1N7SRQ1_9BURK|nr:MFS transporter [Paraburkholderia piptadeniae]SIT49569.1 putative transporter, Major facilitator superfamily MFS_1 [Paraburkholderia piptadeniae]
MALNFPETARQHGERMGVSRAYAWVIFALTLGLLLSDYMSRQVLNSVFPLIKAEWGLSDTQLGTLSGIVSLSVGLLAFPLSLAADRWGRVRSVTIMAAVWSIATLFCGLSDSYLSLLSARFLVGAGEAAYASVGVAILISIFPSRLTSTITGAFMAGSMVGSVTGVGLGGVLASHFGWRNSFVGMAVYGITLTLLYALFVRPSQIERKAEAAEAGIGEHEGPREPASVGRLLKRLFAAPALPYVYIGSGVQLFINGGLIAWLPTFLHRTYNLPLSQAGGVAAMFVLCAACGMAVCGALADRLCRDPLRQKLLLTIGYNLASGALLFTAFQFSAGTTQLACIALALFFSASVIGPSGNLVAQLTPKAIHSTAMATLALACNLFGLAPGAVVTGALADRFGLTSALLFLPLASVASAAILIVGVRRLHADRQNPSPSCARCTE